MAESRDRNGDRLDLDISEHAHDAISKAAAGLLVGLSPRALGVDAPRITAVVATELPEVTVRTRVLDYVFETEDGAYLHVEFQSGRADLARFLVYDAGLFLRDGRRIRTAVVYTGQLTRAPDRLDIGAARYQVENVFIRSADGDRVYDQLVRKVEDGQALDRADAVQLALRSSGTRTESVANEAPPLYALYDNIIRMPQV